MDLIQSALLAVCTIILGLMLREQVLVRKRMTTIELKAAQVSVYLALICDSLGIPYIKE